MIICSLKATQMYKQPFRTAKEPVQPLAAQNSFLPYGKKFWFLAVFPSNGNSSVNSSFTNYSISPEYICQVPNFFSLQTKKYSCKFSQKSILKKVQIGSIIIFLIEMKIIHICNLTIDFYENIQEYIFLFRISF